MAKQNLLLVFKNCALKIVHMNSDALRPIISGEITNYQRDGVVLLRGLFDLEWIDLLDKGLIANCEDPTDRSRVWDRDAEGRTMFWDSQAWQGIDEYRQFIFDSPAALSRFTSVRFLQSRR